MPTRSLLDSSQPLTDRADSSCFVVSNLPRGDDGESAATQRKMPRLETQSPPGTKEARDRRKWPLPIAQAVQSAES